MSHSRPASATAAPDGRNRWRKQAKDALASIGKAREFVQGEVQEGNFFRSWNPSGGRISADQGTRYLQAIDEAVAQGISETLGTPGAPAPDEADLDLSTLTPRCQAWAAQRALELIRAQAIKFHTEGEFCEDGLDEFLKAAGLPPAQYAQIASLVIEDLEITGYVTGGEELDDVLTRLLDGKEKEIAQAILGILGQRDLQITENGTVSVGYCDTNEDLPIR
jgi:hypothetical protein